MKYVPGPNFLTLCETCQVHKENMPANRRVVSKANMCVVSNVMDDLHKVAEHLHTSHLDVQGANVIPNCSLMHEADICALDSSDVANASILSAGSLEVEALCAPENPASQSPHLVRERPKSSMPHLSAPAIEDNLLYKEFLRFSGGAWTVDAGHAAPASSSAASVGSTPPVKSTRTHCQIHMELGGFLEFLKWADIVPRFSNTAVANGVYCCVSRDSAVAGLDGHIGSLGWVGFQQSVGIVAALIGRSDIMNNDAVQLLNASGAKQFGIFASPVAEQECDDGARTAFLKTFANTKVYTQFSAFDHSETRGMTLKQAVQVIQQLKTNPMFISPSLIAQEFRKAESTAVSNIRASPRSMVAETNAPRLDFEQFGAMMKGICLQIGPSLLLRTVCISLASHVSGSPRERPKTAQMFDNGAPNPPHKPNPRGFLRSSRPCSAPRGLRLAARSPSLIKTENFLKPAPPKWRPSGPVDSKTMARAVATLTPSSMIGFPMVKGKNFLDHEEADFQRLQEDELLATSSSRIKQSTSNSINSNWNQSRTPDCGLKRLEQDARQDYARMLKMSNDVSLHASVSSWIGRSHAEATVPTDNYVDLHFCGGRVIRGGKNVRPQHVVPTAPPGGARPDHARGFKRLCPDPVYETAPVLHAHVPVAVSSSPRRGEKLLRQAHQMANAAQARAM